MQVFQYLTVWTLAGVAITVWMSLVLLSAPMCAFMPKGHWLPFFGGGHLAVALFLPVRGRARLGAAMIVASTAVPVLIRKTWS